MIEKIIIDDVDVSECEYRDWRNFCRCDNSKENEGEERITGRGGCKYNPNCYYKQLKREEQECQQAIDNYVKLDNQRVKEYNKLVDLYKSKEQEYEELKKECEKLKED